MSIVRIPFRAIIAHFGIHHTSRLHLPSLIAMLLSTSTSFLTFVCHDENTNELEKKERNTPSFKNCSHEAGNAFIHFYYTN